MSDACCLEGCLVLSMGHARDQGQLVCEGTKQRRGLSLALTASFWCAGRQRWYGADSGERRECHPGVLARGARDRPAGQDPAGLLGSAAGCPRPAAARTAAARFPAAFPTGAPCVVSPHTRNHGQGCFMFIIASLPPPATFQHTFLFTAHWKFAQRGCFRWTLCRTRFSSICKRPCYGLK